MDKFPACFDQNIGMNLGKDAYLFQRSKRESSAILVGLIPDFRLYQQDSLPYYIIQPISDFLLYPSHTPLFRSYSETSCEGCEERRLRQINLNTETPRYRVVLFYSYSINILCDFVPLCFIFCILTLVADDVTYIPIHT